MSLVSFLIDLRSLPFVFAWREESDEQGGAHLF